MASAFWTLEDGRGYARRWSGMAYILKLITDELKEIKDAKEFYEYLEKFVFREETGDEYNGFGGFIRGDENIMFNFDLRTFALQNRGHFWLAAQKALTKLKIQEGDQYEGVIFHLTTLMDMHKRIKKGESPMELNDLRIIVPEPDKKLGPGWGKQL